MHKRVFRRGLTAIAIGLFGCSIVVLTPGVASAATTIVVANNHDSGPGSLRQAFAAASSGGAHQGVDVSISIPASVSNITLTSGELQYDGGSGGGHSLSVTANGQTIATATSGGFDVETSGTFTVNNVKLAISGTGGDGIFVAQGPVVTNQFSVTGADNGIRNASLNGTVAVTDTQIIDSQDSGIDALGGVTLVRSTVAGSADYGVNSDHGTATLTNSTVTGNGTDATFSGIWAINVVLKYSTVVENGTHAGDHDVFAQVNLTSSASVVALQGHGAACHVGGTTHSLGYNLSDDASCHFTGTGDHQGASNAPKLAALAGNGGATQTRLPTAASPLIDAIPASACLAGITTDQRGVSRPQGSACDIGAVEVAEAPPATTTTTTASHQDPVTTPPSTVAPAAATLPRTGSNALTGALIAFGLLLVGTLLLRGARPGTKHR